MRGENKQGGVTCITQQMDEARSIAFYVYRQAGFRFDLQDMTQEAYLALVEAYHKGGDPDTLPNYARIRMFGRVRDYVREQVKHDRPTVDDLPELIDNRPRGDYCDLRSLSTLPDDIKKVIEAVYLHGKTYAELAADAGYANGSGLFKKVQRALRGLREPDGAICTD